MNEKIFVQTYGCSMNYSDSEVMLGLLKSEDYEIVDKKEDADLLVINSCTVKDAAEKKLNHLVKSTIKNKNQKVVVTGCVPQADKNWLKNIGREIEVGNGLISLQEKKTNIPVSVLGVRQVHKIVDVVEETLQGNSVQILDVEKNPRLNLPKIRKNENIEIIPINQGCLGNCYFCKTKLARGGLFSYSVDAIKNQFQSALDEGIKEIWLTSQDTGAYGYDIKTRLHNLMNELTSIDGDFIIRLGMINPDLVIKIVDDLVEAFDSDKVYKFLHIPIQAGSNKVLKDMNRLYTVEEFRTIVDKFKAKFPDITIATDIITGYNGETEEEFQESIDICKEYNIHIVNVAKFFPRPGTKAFGEKQLPSHVRKDRSKRLMEAIYTYSPYDNWLGWEGRCLFNEEGKENTDTIVGRNFAYVPVVVKGKKHQLGRWLNVKITEIHRDFVIGEIV